MAPILDVDAAHALLDMVQTLVDDVVRDAELAHDGRCRCLLYTSDAADERSSVDLGGRRIIKKKKKRKV